MIKVLIVEDSAVAQDLLRHVLGSDAEMTVMDVAGNGLEALEILKRKKPDVITMDLQMPHMNGLEATRRIMEILPTPILIASGSLKVTDTLTAFDALEAGAVGVVVKPLSVSHPDYKASAETFVSAVKKIAKVKIGKRPAHPARKGESSASHEPFFVFHPIRLIAIGASTGGPPALHAILAALPQNFSVPVLITQHIAAGFTEGLCQWLGRTTNFPVRLAKDHERPQAGQAYLSPDGFRMGVDTGGRIVLERDIAENGAIPAITHLFRSVARAFGAGAAGILLTGMGEDGADGLLELRRAGGYTIAESASTAVIYGMPAAAVARGAVCESLSLENVAPRMMEITHA